MSTPQEQDNAKTAEDFTARLKQIKSCDDNLKPKLQALQSEILRLLGPSGPNWGSEKRVDFRR
jgi:hypothetical protein